MGTDPRFELVTLAGLVASGVPHLTPFCSPQFGGRFFEVGVADCAADPDRGQRAYDDPNGDNSDNPPHSWECAMGCLALSDCGPVLVAGSPPVSPDRGARDWKSPPHRIAHAGQLAGRAA